MKRQNSTNLKKKSDKDYEKWLRDENVPIKERVESTWNKQYDYLVRFVRLTIPEKEDFYRLFKVRKEIKKAHKQYVREQRQLNRA